MWFEHVIEMMNPESLGLTYIAIDQSCALSFQRISCKQRMEFHFILNFCWTMVDFVVSLNTPILDFVTLPMSFKARVVLSPALLLPCAW